MPYTVRASNTAFCVCTKPFAARKTVLYTIIDWEQNVRGAEDLVFGMGAETTQECEEMLERLTLGESEVSYRNRVELDIVKYLRQFSR
jgi:siroheme synthase